MARRLPLVSGHASSHQSHRHSNRTSSSSRRGRSHQTRSSPHSSHSTHSASHSSHASPSHSSSSHSSFRAQQGESRGSSRRGHHRSSRHPSSEATTPALSSSSSSSSSVSSTSSAAASTSASGSTNTGSTGRTGRVSSMGEGRRPSTASSVAALSDLSACSGQSTTRNATQKPAKKDSKLLPFTPVYRQFNLASHVDKRRVCANWRVTHFPEIWALAKNRFLRAQDDDQYIDSPLFGDAEVGFWFLRLYPYGDSKNAGSLELYLMVDSNLTEDVLVHYKLQIFKQSPSGFPASQTQTKRDFIVQYEDSDVYSKNEPGVGYGPTHLCDVSTRRKARALTWSDGSLKIRALLDCPILEALVGPQSSTSSAARPRPLVALRHLSCKSEGFEKKGKTHALQRRTATTLSEEVAAFIEHEKDMEIEFRGETFPANKLILVSRSKVFRAMLKGLFQEGLKDSAALSPFLPRLSGQKRARTESSETRNLSKLNLSETAGLTVSALKNLLLYMHTDTCPLLSAETEEQKEEKSTQQKEVETINSLLELLVAADLYDVQCVYERCIDEIISRLSCQNFAAILFCASRINCRRLVKASRQFANSLAGGAVAGKMLQLLERWWSSASSGLSFSSVSLSASPEHAASPRGRRSRDGSPCSDEDIVAIHPEGSILLKPLGAGAQEPARDSRGNEKPRRRNSHSARDPGDETRAVCTPKNTGSGQGEAPLDFVEEANSTERTRNACREFDEKDPAERHRDELRQGEGEAEREREREGAGREGGDAKHGLICHPHRRCFLHGEFHPRGGPPAYGTRLVETSSSMFPPGSPAARKANAVGTVQRGCECAPEFVGKEIARPWRCSYTEPQLSSRKLQLANRLQLTPSRSLSFSSSASSSSSTSSASSSCSTSSASSSSSTSSASSPCSCCSCSSPSRYSSRLPSCLLHPAASRCRAPASAHVSAAALCGCERGEPLQFQCFGRREDGATEGGRHNTDFSKESSFSGALQQRLCLDRDGQSSPLSLLRRSPASAPSRPRKKLRSALEEGTCGAFETDEWAEYQWLESECSGGRSKGKEDDCSACTQRCCSRRGFVEEGQLGLPQTEEISMGSSKSLQDTLSSSSRNLCRNSAHNSSSFSSFVSSSTSSSPCSSSRSSSTSVSSSSSSASSSSASSSSASSSSLGHSGEALHAAAASQEFRGESDRRGSSGDQTGGAFHDACSTSSFSEMRAAGDGTFPHCSRPCRFWRGTACSSAPRLCQSSCSLPVLSLSPRSGELSSEKDWLSAKRSLSLPSASASDASANSSSAPRSLTEAHAHAASPSPRRQMETALSVGTHEEGTTRFLSPETTSSPSLQSPPSGEGDASRAVASATSCMSPSGTQAEEIAPEPHSKRDSERETLSGSDAGGSCEKPMNHGSTETGCEIRGWTEVEKRQNATTCDALAADGCTPSQGRSDRGQPQESGVCSSRGVHTAKRRRHSDGGGTQTSAESVDSFRERSTLQSDCPTAGNQCESRVFGPEKDLGGTERGNCQDAAETNQLLLSESLFGGLVGEPHENDLRKENASPRRESPRCKKQSDARDHREPLPRQRATVGLSSCSSSDYSSACFPSSLSPSTYSSCLSYSLSPSSSLSASTSSSSFSASSSSSSSVSELKTRSALRSPLGGLP